MSADTEAIEAVKRGEKDRYAELVARYQRMVYGIAWSQLGDSDLCEEAAQETFVRAYRYLVALRNPDRFAGWLARIARSVSVSILRKHMHEINSRERWRLEMPPPEGRPQPALEDQSLGGSLREVLAELPASHRECLVLFYLEEKNIREAATLLNISESAMKTRLHRARAELRGRLEERLERSLTQLAPRSDLSAVIPALLPAMPLAAGLGASSAAAKAFSGLGLVASLALQLVVSLFQGLGLFALLGWYAKLESENIASGPGRDLRKRMIKRSFFIMGAVGFLAMTLSQWASMRFGPLAVFQLLVPFTLWGLWRAAKTLRVNCAPFVWGQILANATFLFVFILIGFCGAPYWTFFAGLLMLNFVLYETNKSKPSRHDYNLFLRQATGGLGRPKPARSHSLRCTRAQLRAFARFLGNRFLVTGYTFQGDGIRLCLPPVSPGARMYFGLSDSTSSVRISADGTVVACLGRGDLRQLRRLTKDPASGWAALEEQVANVVNDAFRHFMDAGPAGAQALLQPESDADIFVRPIGESRARRVQGGLAIGAGIVMLIVFAFFPFPLDHRARSKPVSLHAAADALLTWSRAPQPNGDLYHVLRAAEQPAPSFFEGRDPAAYRAAVFSFLEERTIGNPMERLSQSDAIAQPLYHALREHTLSQEQFATLGFTPEHARHALDRMDTNLFAVVERQGSMTRTSSNGSSYNSPDFEDMAYRLACLDQLGCLDCVDTHFLPALFAAHQITANWEIPEGYAPIDTAKAAGLFSFGWCDLRNTRASLWILQLLGQLDTIDREACVQGLLRFHQGQGKFQSDHQTDPWITLDGQEDDRYYALESLNILDALDRVPDLKRWKYGPVTTTRETKGQKEFGVLTGEAVVHWAYQLRLQELRGY